MPDGRPLELLGDVAAREDRQSLRARNEEAVSFEARAYVGLLVDDVHGGAGGVAAGDASSAGEAFES
mgnify:CR=1 FL=1